MTQRSVVIVKIGIWAACLAPLGLLVLRAFGCAGSLGANDVETVLNICGKTGLNLLDAHAVRHADPALDGHQQAHHVSPAARAIRVLLSRCCTS